MPPATVCRLRELTPADYAAVITLWRSCPGIGLTEADSYAGTVAYLARNPGLSVVATDLTGAIVGAVLCGHDGRRGYLHHLAVAPASRRQGIGRQLVEECLARLRTAGIAKCNLFLFADNAAGRAFWLRCGWHTRLDLMLVQRATT
ncbi:GNAT family N-acetyltransferase [Horticoccus luteus]|uniref:GNAT family N-acetyltransferase n=1 Tax=Horticoccus luteus TaxID=2862869 RepID=A0A8F9TTW1_9BACT|nr:GNAT family N-acetyltransferase [Horticoccus luteus]QYM77704.1 GNAT family N-acetyltransferase [Horticoccus luteus]